jgi:hypothetical protein
MKSGKRIKLGYPACFLLGGFFSLALAACVSLYLPRWSPFRVPAVTEAQAKALSASASGPAKSWGQLEAFELPLANCGGLYPDTDRRLKPPTWFFDGISEDRVERFLGTCDLLPVQRKVLLDKQYWNVTSNGCTISPPMQLVWFLDPKSRERIYSVLSKTPANYEQAFPFRFSVEYFELPFRESGLSAEQIKRLKKLTYESAGSLCFSDLHAAQDLFSPAEFQSVLATLYAVPAYALRLRVSTRSDVETLTRYWGRGGREKQVAPLLQALAKVPGGGVVNVSHLLPPFARLHLDTYPDAWQDPTVDRQDCFFSSLNFYNEHPDTNFFDLAYTQKILDSEYAEPKDDPLLGDLVLLCNSKGAPIHMCVYVAQDFVFTKNGVSRAQPWVLMRLADTLQIYSAPEDPARLRFLRHIDKQPAALTAQAR